MTTIRSKQGKSLEAKLKSILNNKSNDVFHQNTSLKYNKINIKNSEYYDNIKTFKNKITEYSIFKSDSVNFKFHEALIIDKQKSIDIIFIIKFNKNSNILNRFNKIKDDKAIYQFIFNKSKYNIKIKYIITISHNIHEFFKQEYINPIEFVNDDDIKVYNGDYTNYHTELFDYFNKN
jgi:hypothetical protein